MLGIEMMSRPVIVAVVVFQALCAFFFIFDISSSLFGVPFGPISWQVHELIEIAAALGLLVGLGLGTWALMQVLRRNARIERQLMAASGAFAELMEERFEEWALTPAERDVALFCIKGMSLQEIADLRGTSSGTVKAQTNAIYRKAGVSGRSQLLSLFVEDLLSGDLKARA
ncbi:MAG: helix-turn-helix transcriptional regulator [Pseudomonadota bacterium]